METDSTTRNRLANCLFVNHAS